MSRVSANSLHLAFWFSDEGIITTDTALSPLFLLVAGVGVVLVLLAPGYFRFVIAIGASGALYLIAALTSSRIRRDYSTLPVEELVKKQMVKTFAWSEVNFIRVQGRKIQFSISGKNYRASMPESDIGEFARLIDSKRAADLLTPKGSLDVPAPSSLRPRSPVTLALAGLAIIGAIMMPIGSAITAGPMTDVGNFIFQLGLCLLLDSGTVYGLLRPRMMSPIPRVVGYAGLVILNVAVPLIFTSIRFSPEALILLTVGILLTGAVGGTAIRHLVRKDVYEPT